MTSSFRPTRRRAIALIAATSAVAMVAGLKTGSSRAIDDDDALVRWQGQALGANASLHIHGRDRQHSSRLLRLALDEIARLEGVFSLYRADSALVLLNRDGSLDNPPAELVSILADAKQFSSATDGAFDVTVQPLWSLYQAHFARNNADPRGPSRQEIAQVQSLVDPDALDVSTKRVAFRKPGMAVTLNGIAQGQITDIVSDLLASEGLEHSLIDLGETRAIGQHPEGRPWQIGLKNAFDPTRLSGKLSLTNQALATSAVTGTIFDNSGRHHHIFDPATGAPGRGLISASVIAPRAAAADAISTAMLASMHPISSQTLARLGVEKVITTDRDGDIRAQSLI